MSVRLLLTDEVWAAIAPILATLKSRAGRPPVLSDRLFIEAVLYLARTGLPWRDLPKDFGRWDAVYNRFRRWEVRGIWRRLWEHLQTEDGPITCHLFLDATMVPRDSYLRNTIAQSWGYGHQVWILPGERRMFLLLGISGQALFVDPESKLIMVQTAVRKLPVGDPKSPEAMALWYAVVAQYGHR